MALNARDYFQAVVMPRSWLTLAVVAFNTLPSKAVVVARGRGCALGEFPGPGSPPCVKKYEGSGNIHAPRESDFLTNIRPRMSNPAGVLYPGCICRAPGQMPPRPAAFRAPVVANYSGLTPGEVEVLTVDVRLANRVRCDNVTIAADIAKRLKIPVKRITVTPWSWSLPDGPPQPNYLAFLQEDHERCDCEGQDGHLEGYRKLKTATDGWMVAPGTSVMTVSQFQALHGGDLECGDGLKLTPIPSRECPVDCDLPKCDDVAGGELCAGDGVCGTDKDLDNCGEADIYRKADPSAGSAGASGSTLPIAPPSSRVQMLTRDPCLVRLLRDMTPHFKKKIAFFLGLPEDKVIVDPPPVKGTVGLLQMDTTLNSEREVRQVPMLGVRECNLVELSESMKRLSLVAGAAPAPAPANNLVASAPGLLQPMVYAVAGFNNTNGTNATNVTTQGVLLSMKLDNLDYDLLAGSWPLVSSFTAVAKAAIGEAGHIPEDSVKLALYPGSVVIEAQIIPPPETAPEAVLAFLNGTVCNTTVAGLTPMLNSIGEKSLLNGALDCSLLSLAIQDLPFESDQSDETNRPWIALWSIVTLPPFAEDGAWRLLKMVNDPGSDLSKLLPMTLARIPGMKYRALQEPNAAIKFANETRLPPPEDKAVGFALPSPYAEEAALEAERKRRKRENEARTLMVKEKSAMEQRKAQDALQNAQREVELIKKAKVRFSKAARRHAEAVRGESEGPLKAQTGPDIVPYEALAEPYQASESPYPWRDQVPRPNYMYSLAQDPPTHSRAFLSQQPSKAA